jgi:hypothetical protein
MAMEGKSGQMAQHLKATMLMERRRVEDPLLGRMAAPTPEIFQTIISTAEVFTSGLMEESIQALGLTIKCMVMGFLLGLMAEGTRENI